MTCESIRSCLTCRWQKETGPSPCGDCVQSTERLPKWERKPVSCGRSMCADRACVDCFPTPGIGHSGGPKLDVFTRHEAPGGVASRGLDGKGPENPKAQYGRAKPQLGLVPGAAAIEMAGVFQLGAEKYGQANWRATPVEAGTYMHAALRHMQSWFDGEDVDPESGLSHLAHAASCCAIVIDAGHCGTLIDNRPHRGVSAELIRQRTKAIA